MDVYTWPQFAATVGKVLLFPPLWYCLSCSRTLCLTSSVTPDLHCWEATSGERQTRTTTARAMGKMGTTPWTLWYFLKQLPSVQFCSLEGQPQWEELLDLPQNNPERHNDKWGLSSLLCYRITILLDIPQTAITITLHLLYSYFHRLFTMHAPPILTMNR